MTWTGKTTPAVMPQIIAAPQPPRSITENPSDPSRKPGFARQITNPSYQRSVFRSWRSSTTASATLYLLCGRPSRGPMSGRAAKVTPAQDTFNGPPKTGQRGGIVQSVRGEPAPDHDQVRVWRDHGGCLRS